MELSGRIAVTTEPENSEFPLARLQSWITPVEQFYVRNHFPRPEIAAGEWRLSLAGRGSSSDLTLADLEDLPWRSVVAVLECAGNGRRYNPAPVAGVQWGAGAVSNGEWSGPALRDVLAAGHGADSAGVRHVHLTGADRGRPGGVEHEIPFRRSIPIEKALDRDTLVALRLNGEPLTPAHGAPARLIVPGWYGMASVKWLTAIRPAESPSEDHFMIADYTRTTVGGRREPLDWVAPKAEIARPRVDAEVAAGTTEVVGAAWAGQAPLDRVDVSNDGGREWHPASLDGPPTRYGWRLWRWSWRAEPGVHRLAARATDQEGRTQPDAPDAAAPGYCNHWVRPRTVTVV